MNAIKTRRTLCVAVPVALAIAIFLLIRGCGKKPEPEVAEKEALFVPGDLARLKKLDRDGVLEYCRTQIRPANYEGILRGAHGALWAGEANAWDRVLLAAEALEGMKIENRVVPGDPARLAYKDGARWVIVRLDAKVDAEHADQPPAESVALADLPAQHPELFHTIQPSLVMDTDVGESRWSPAAAERVAEWAYRPVVLNTVGEGDNLHYQFQVGSQTLGEAALRGCRRVRLELTWRYKDQSSTWTRVLFDHENVKPAIPGHDAARTGDRYAIVVAAGPLMPEVLPTRTRMFELPGYTPVDDEPSRELLALGTKYQVDSDERTWALAGECKVDVAWTLPRIAIVASEVSSDGKDKPGLTVDALADAVEASGPRAREFHVARGLATDLVETRVVYEARRRPVISTSTVFSNFKADSPDSPSRRVTKIETEARRMLSEEPIGSITVLSALPPRSESVDETTATKSPARPTLTIERTADGLALRGLTPVDKAVAPWEGYAWNQSGTVAFGDRSQDLARVADGMLARKAGYLDYMLAFEVKTVWPRRSLPVTAGSVLTYVAQTKGKTERIAVEIQLDRGSPTGTWTNLETGKKGPVRGKWPEVLVADSQGMSMGVVLGPASAEGEAVKVAVQIGENDRKVAGRKIAITGGNAVELMDDGLPILLEWQHGDLALRLESASPVVRGTTRDAETHLPVTAEVALTRTVDVPVRNPIDLSKWKQEGPIKNGIWDVAPDGGSVLQKVNGDPTFFVSPDEYIDTTIRGKLRVDDLADDDYVGFVFGYQSPIRDKGHKDNDFDFLLFDWKKGNQAPAREGFSLVRVHGNFDMKENGEYAGFWDHKKRPQFEVLATDFGKGKGWKARTDHEFELSYHRDRVQISIDGKPIFDVKGSFKPGRFGFFNFSQEMVSYSGFASVGRKQTQVAVRKVDAAADGSFALAVPGARRRLILVLDRSGSMVYGLNPKDGLSPRDPPAKKGEQRIDYLRTAVNGLLDKLPKGVEVALWSFSTGPIDRDFENPRHTTVDCPFTTDLSRVRKAMEAIKPAHGTPLTGAINKALDHIEQDPLSANAQIVLLTDGENSSKVPAANVYRERKGSVVIHTIGFAIEPRGKAEQELRDLAEVSGGQFRIAGTGEALALAFEKLGTESRETQLVAKSSCHGPVEIRIPASDLGGAPLEVRMRHGCATCKCGDKTFLTVRKDNVQRLKECQGLSAKARQMIEERVKDGGWIVTIPTRRVNLGVVSAYAWWEIEPATGRMVGRTEDGLHGASVDPRSWPAAARDEAGKIPFVAWYTGIVAYTAGSVDAAMRWTRQPGFLNGTPEDLKRFIQANALDFAGRWWSEVGASAFPENMHNYWAGVCLNFTLQSMALGLPATDCLRQWAGALCDQAASTVRDTPKEMTGPFFKDHFGGQFQAIYSKAKELADRAGISPTDKAAAQSLLDDLDNMKKAWDDGVGQAFDCSRLRGGPVGARAGTTDR